MPWLYWTSAVVLGTAAITTLAWSLFWDRSRGRLRCPRCWYDMSGGAPLTCPECGTTVTSERRLRRTRRRRRWALLAVVGAAGAVALALTPRVQRDGWTALVPDSLLITAMSHDPVQNSQLARALASRSDDLTRSEWQRLERVLIHRLQRDRDADTWAIVASAVSNLRMQRQLPMLGVEFLSGFDAEDAQLRFVAAFGAALCMPPEHVAIDPLLSALDDDDSRVRTLAAWALLRYGTDTEPMSRARPRLRQAAADTTEPDQLRSYALRMLMPWESYDHSLTPVVLDLLQSPQWVIRTQALLRLRGLTSPSPEILAQVRALLNDPAPVVRSSAAWRLAQFDDRASIDAIIGLLDDAEWTVRRGAASALGEFGPDSAAALPRLREMVEFDPSTGDPVARTQVKDAAAEAIEKITAEPRPDA